MKSSILSVLAATPAALAAVRGFNYASQTHTYDSFVQQFKTAAGLEGANDYTSARLYTMIQEGTTNTPIEAIQAAIDTKTTLLLGLWASVDQATFDHEISALKSAIEKYGSEFADLVVGISVGSEDLYRISPIGIAADSGYGQSPDVLVEYISQVRDAVKGTSLSSKPIGHVDTWNIYVNSSNSAVISACDFLGLDEYPYFQTTDENEIGNAQHLFFEAYDKIDAVSGGKPIWITEAGWPVSGPKSNLAVANVDNAAVFWQDVACELEQRDINTWWYILADAGASPSFGISDNGKPLYDLDCSNYTGLRQSNSTSNSTSSSTSSSRPSSTGPSDPNAIEVSSSSGAATATGTATSGSGSGSNSSGSNNSGSGSGSNAASTLATGTRSSASSTSSAPGGSFTGAASRLEHSIAGMIIGGAFAVLAL